MVKFQPQSIRTKLPNKNLLGPSEWISALTRSGHKIRRLAKEGSTIENLVQILFIAILITGCGTSGRINQTTFDSIAGQEITTELSQYFESKVMIADEQLQAHIIVTLGSERIPPGYKLQQKVNRYQDQIEEVTEIYFSNKGPDPITISKLSLQSPSSSFEILPSEITIEPGKWVKTEPIITVTSVYRPDSEAVLSYELDKAKLTAVLPQIRTPVSELRK